jgi:hypothetical protein
MFRHYLTNPNAAQRRIVTMRTTHAGFCAVISLCFLVAPANAQADKLRDLESTISSLEGRLGIALQNSSPNSSDNVSTLETQYAAQYKDFKAKRDMLNRDAIAAQELALKNLRDRIDNLKYRSGGAPKTSTEQMAVLIERLENIVKVLDRKAADHVSGGANAGALATSSSNDAPLPNEQRIKEDLIGRMIAANTLDGTYKFSSMAQFRDLQIRERKQTGSLIEFKIGMDLEGPNRNYIASAIVVYKCVEGKWTFTDITITRFY